MKKVGLALSSGATRGGFSIGVGRALLKAGIHIDMVSGSSVGSLGVIGFGLEMSPDFMEEWAEKTKVWQYIRPETNDDLGVLNCGQILKRVTDVVGDLQFSQFKIPVVMVALDLETSEVALFKDGSVLEALRASIGAPSLFPPLRKNNRYYVDAGLVDPLPIDVLRNMGAGIIIAVDQGPMGKNKMHFLKEHKLHIPILEEIDHIHSSWVVLNHVGGALHRNAINRAIEIQRPDYVISAASALKKSGVCHDIVFTDTSCFKKLSDLGEEETNLIIPNILKIL